ncbi:hypothetical protein [Leifsonia sp. NPDC058248]|uniref:hypothetical protein n=1 Tax=Leifsonia sp. NPDC058248 TaxID=3346402 RepID=UPI0036DB02A7
MTTNLDKLIEQQRALAKQIRDAKRSALRREREALERARRSLGDRLSKSMGADTPEDVAALGDLLDTEQIRRYAATHLADAQGHDSAHGGDSGSLSSVTDHVGDPTVAEGGDSDDYRA